MGCLGLLLLTAGGVYVVWQGSAWLGTWFDVHAPFRPDDRRRLVLWTGFVSSALIGAAGLIRHEAWTKRRAAVLSAWKTSVPMFGTRPRSARWRRRLWIACVLFSVWAMCFFALQSLNALGDASPATLRQARLLGKLRLWHARIGCEYEFTVRDWRSEGTTVTFHVRESAYRGHALGDLLAVTTGRGLFGWEWVRGVSPQIVCE